MFDLANSFENEMDDEMYFGFGNNPLSGWEGNTQQEGSNGGGQRPDTILSRLLNRTERFVVAQDKEYSRSNPNYISHRKNERLIYIDI
jgi:hypothetical protein